MFEGAHGRCPLLRELRHHNQQASRRIAAQLFAGPLRGTTQFIGAVVGGNDPRRRATRATATCRKPELTTQFNQAGTERAAGLWKPCEYQRR